MDFFKYSELRKFLRHLNDNYKVTSLRDWDGSNQIILRFDVDLNIESAHKMGLLFNDLGFRASFFIQTACLFYNPLAEKNRKLLKEMSDLGFEIGLHFNPSIYPRVEKDNLKDKVDKEASVLEFITGKKVQSISIHNPSVHGEYPLFQGYKNAYDSRIFREDRYLSDSRQHFRHDPYEFIKRVILHLVQILLHPFHYSESGDNYGGIFYYFTEKLLGEIDKSFQVNSEYRRCINPHLLEHFMSHTMRNRGEKKT